MTSPRHHLIFFRVVLPLFRVTFKHISSGLWFTLKYITKYLRMVSIREGTMSYHKRASFFATSSHSIMFVEIKTNKQWFQSLKGHPHHSKKASPTQSSPSHPHMQCVRASPIRKWQQGRSSSIACVLAC